MDGLEKATVLDKSSWCTSSQHCFFTFFPVSSSSQCCLSQLPHQILHTNIGRARRQKSIPTILTETVGAQGVQPQENVTTFLNLFWVPITSSWPPKEKKIFLSDRVRRSQLPPALGDIVVQSRRKMKCLEHSASFYNFNSQRFPKQLKRFHHNVETVEIHVSILCSGALRNKTKEVNLPYTYKGFPLSYSPSLGAKNTFLMYQNCLFEYLTASGCAKVG